MLLVYIIKDDSEPDGNVQYIEYIAMLITSDHQNKQCLNAKPKEA